MTTCNFSLDLEGLPTPPSIAMSLLDMFGQPDVKIDDLAKVIRIDPALSAKIIAFCNSPLMGLSRKVDSVDRAIVLLGINAVQMIALSFSLVDINDDANDEIDFEQFWNFSLAIAVACQAIARHRKLDGELAFLVGLMLNIGEIAIYRNSGKRRELREQSPVPPVEIQQYVDLETRIIGTNRYLVGASLLEEWEFPQDIIDVLQQLGDDQQEDGELTEPIRCGFLLAALLITDDLLAEQIEKIRAMISEHLQVDEEALEEVFQLAQQAWLDYSELLNLENNWNVKTLRDMENAAKFRMTALSISQAKDQQKTLEENDKLRSAVSKDALTGVFNRSAYDEQAARDFARCRRNERPFSLIVIDIDHFKKFNDTYGHQVGDQVLKQVAKVMQSRLREYDNLYRYGGEEFVVTLPECAEEHAIIVAERLRASVEEIEIQHEEGPLKVTISVGTAFAEDPGDVTLEHLFELADECLYKAKSNGRNCCIAQTVSQIR